MCQLSNPQACVTPAGLINLEAMAHHLSQLEPCKALYCLHIGRQCNLCLYIVALANTILYLGAVFYYVILAS
jgi:hypothetical protein